jgi:hypothetical protein
MRYGRIVVGILDLTGRDLADPAISITKPGCAGVTVRVMFRPFLFAMSSRTIARCIHARA